MNRREMITLTTINRYRSIPKNGLIGYWRFLPGDTEQLALDSSVLLNHLQYGSLVGADTNDPVKNADGCLTFGGDDYLRQRALATMQGTVTASMVNGVAFINDSGQTFTPYVRANGSSRYVLVAEDSAGVRAWGFIGELGTGETLGAIATPITNGDMETGDPPTGWAGINGATVDGVADERTGGSGSQSLEVARGTSNDVCVKVISGNLGYLLKGHGWVKNIDAPEVGALFYNAGWTLKSVYTSSTDWTYLEVYATDSDDSLGFYFRITTTAGKKGRFDDWAVERVLTPSANGVKIYSTKTGTTQNWAGIESGFNADDITSYEIRTADFNLTSAMTLIYIFRPNGADEEGYVIAKTTSGDGYATTISAANTIDFAYGDGVGGYLQVSSNAVFTEFGSYARAYIAVGADLNVDFYKNGAWLNQETLLNALDESTAPLVIGTIEGSLTEGTVFKGDIALIALYNRKLSATEIAIFDRVATQNLTNRRIINDGITFSHGAGTLNISIDNGDNVRWILPNGSIYSGATINQSVSAGRTILLCDNISDGDIEFSVVSNPTVPTFSLSDLQGNLTYYLNLYDCTNITGSLSDVSAVTYFLRLSDCTNITGSLSDVSAVTYYLSLSNCTNITGSLSDVSAITYYLSLSNCTNITGSLSDLGAITYYLRLSNCTNITGVYTPVGAGTPTYTYLDNTGLSTADMDNTLIAYAAATKDNGTFTATGMTRSVTSDAAVTTLEGRGWTITVPRI